MQRKMSFDPTDVCFLKASDLLTDIDKVINLIQLPSEFCSYHLFLIMSHSVPSYMHKYIIQHSKKSKKGKPDDSQFLFSFVHS